MLVVVADPATAKLGSSTKVVASEKVEHEEVERRDRWLPMLDMIGRLVLNSFCREYTHQLKYLLPIIAIAGFHSQFKQILRLFKWQLQVCDSGRRVECVAEDLNDGNRRERSRR